MGNDSPCSSSNEDRPGNNIRSQNQNTSLNAYSKYNPDIINKRFEDFIYKDKIIDLMGNKFNMNDPVFQSIHKEENAILTKFFIEKKVEFTNKIDEYLNNQNLNFINMLTKQIISNEGGREILTRKIKDEIQIISNEKKLFKINYLTVMIIGITGTGKSTIVNNILYNGKEVAKESYGDIGTMAPTKEYRSKEVPCLRLIDTRGIELQKGFSADNLGQFFYQFINEQSTDRNADNFVHCIWYCVNPDGNRFQIDEKNLVDELIKVGGVSKIPVIIALTQSVSKIKRVEMRNHIKSKNFEDVVDILARQVELDNGGVREQYGLDDLINLTIKKCKKGYDGNMKIARMKNLTDYVKNRLFSKNVDIQSTIINIMKRETYENDLANQDFEKYINNIYLYNINYFLDKNSMENQSSSLIKTSQFNMHKNNFLAFCQQNQKQLISKELQKFAYQFLDIQASKEIEKGNPVSMVNKRNFNGFINTAGKFLDDNFDYYAKKIYINYVIINICGKLSEGFAKELNVLVENLMINNEIQAVISECFEKKFSEFVQNIRSYPPFPKIYNNYLIQNDDIGDSDWMNIPKISYDTKYNSEDIIFL